MRQWSAGTEAFGALDSAEFHLGRVEGHNEDGNVGLKYFSALPLDPCRCCIQRCVVLVAVGARIAY